MDKKGIKEQGGYMLPVGILFFSGFLLGALVPNLAWKMKWQQENLASVYLLGIFADRGVAAKEYFLEVLRMRGSYFLLSVLCGFSVFGVPLAVLGILILGAGLGALLTMSVLQFGLWGGAVGLGLLFPQYLCYLPGTALMMRAVFCQSADIWKNHGLFPQKIYHYGKRCGAAGLIYFGGILLESFCNPWIVEKILSAVKIF